ncbi:MoxR family ATPase [Methylomonas sp. MED-D]|uniref:MoxR family ATPase n=1 Tax=unclassified Methylomonas TaxID=2608980 RepID=UPI0028A31EDF|nr:MoxR family ATPase [Methylomonas sp. MV1]MDT4328599.1 MoxR family ATPase [Methylomonas sp. MV1]
MTDIKRPDPVTYYLPAVGTWPESHYLLDGRCQDAIRLAEASGRPLLVRGLPGTGKSDLARAAAQMFERAFVYEVVTARSEPQELLWRFDAVARLADAQAREPRAKDVSHYIAPGPLWWSIDWRGAEQWLREHEVHAQRPDAELTDQSGQAFRQAQRAETKGCVLLLDEIDKADSELPNSLLEVLANNGFRLPCADGYEVKARQHKPLIIVTTNEDRELPAAFVRRCLVLPLAADADFKQWLIARARSHYRDPDDASQAGDGRPAMAQTLLEQAAQRLMDDRAQLRGEAHLPGLAEYLDLLRGLDSLARNNPAQQQQWLDRVCDFAYRKSASLSA